LRKLSRCGAFSLNVLLLPSIRQRRVAFATERERMTQDGVVDAWSPTIHFIQESLYKSLIDSDNRDLIVEWNSVNCRIRNLKTAYECYKLFAYCPDCTFFAELIDRIVNVDIVGRVVNF
jgi:hypothetical protein